MVQCPVCEIEIPEPIPPFCRECGWDFEHDITLVPSLHEIPESVKQEYIARVDIMKRNWGLIKKELNAQKKIKIWTDCSLP